MPTDLTIQKIFGSRVRHLRKLHSISQEKLAALSGLDRSYLGSVERGERNISIGNAYKIAGGLNVDIAELFKDGDR